MTRQELPSEACLDLECDARPAPMNGIWDATLSEGACDLLSAGRFDWSGRRAFYLAGRGYLVLSNEVFPEL